MPPVISFVGWHNSGKTTLARQVVATLQHKGYRVAVIKSSKETGIIFDQPGTDTSLYQQSGAEAVALCAPDQLVVQRKPSRAPLYQLAQQLFPDMDIVIAEGFKQATEVPKIEVHREPEAPWIHEQCPGIIALASDTPIPGWPNFTLQQGKEIADFLIKTFLQPSP